LSSLNGDAEASAFQQWMIENLAAGENLLANSISELRFPVPDEFNMGESLSPESRSLPIPIENIADNVSIEFLANVQTKLDH